MTASHARSQLRHRPVPKTPSFLFVTRARRDVNKGLRLQGTKCPPPLAGRLKPGSPPLALPPFLNRSVLFLEQTFPLRCHSK
jgi:hypothetical protein